MNNQTALETTREHSGEIATSAAASLAKATIEAKFVMALKRPRNIMQARSTILDACRRPYFAQSAIYSKPVAGKPIRGLSIRFTETAIQAWGNVDISATTVFETEDQRLIKVTITDLETNLSYGDEIMLNKTVERSNPSDKAEIIGERRNTKGNKVFIVKATEDELQNKMNAAKSKSIRNSGLRLLPQDILDEAWESIENTVAKGASSDPKADIKKICDGFSVLNVTPDQLTAYLGHSVDTISPKELANLREIYTAIKDGESSWNDFVELKKKSEKEAVPTPNFGKPNPDEAAEAAAGLAPVQPAATPEPPKPSGIFASAKAEKSPQDTLGENVAALNFTFAHWLAWAKEPPVNLSEAAAENITAFADVPKAIAEASLAVGKNAFKAGLGVAKKIVEGK